MMATFSQSRIAAFLQEIISKRREEVGLYEEVVDLLRLPPSGRLLEVGCGSGRQLKVVQKRQPTLALFGLDLSEAVIHRAERTLESLDVDLQVGSIEDTDYEDRFFDLVTCFSSMSYWENLVSCFDEIYRILKPGGTTQLIEPQKDVDIDAVVETIKANLADANPLRRVLAANFNKFALKWGRSVGLNLYSAHEIEQIARRSRFAGTDEIKRVSVQNLPIFMGIFLVKHAEGSIQTA
jgi:ubiquinone/menaquinone biosynthesis C-methylase UbiE